MTQKSFFYVETDQKSIFFFCIFSTYLVVLLTRGADDIPQTLQVESLEFQAENKFNLIIVVNCRPSSGDASKNCVGQRSARRTAGSTHHSAGTIRVRVPTTFQLQPYSTPCNAHPRTRRCHHLLEPPRDQRMRSSTIRETVQKEHNVYLPCGGAEFPREIKLFCASI
jgi:hypothetical protein